MVLLVWANMSSKSRKIERERAPLNAEGDFYVEKDVCLACMAPEYEAPELMAYDEQTFCYFKRQPATAEELDHAIEAVCVSCIAALRYAGNDPLILERLRAKGAESQCDVFSINPQVGDIFEIRLPNEQFAYGKVFRDASVGIYEKIFSSRAEPPIKSTFAFIVALDLDILRSGIWPIVSYEAFSSVEEEWPPPVCLKDRFSGDYSIYHKGKIRIATEAECVGLAADGVWDVAHVIDRIMAGTKYFS